LAAWTATAFAIPHFILIGEIMYGGGARQAPTLPEAGLRKAV